jgi:hypothetical protein
LGQSKDFEIFNKKQSVGQGRMKGKITGLKDFYYMNLLKKRLKQGMCRMVVISKIKLIVLLFMVSVIILNKACCVNRSGDIRHSCL